jgi:hypothetical protein
MFDLAKKSVQCLRVSRQIRRFGEQLALMFVVLLPRFLLASLGTVSKKYTPHSSIVTQYEEW